MALPISGVTPVTTLSWTRDLPDFTTGVAKRGSSNVEPTNYPTAPQGFAASVTKLEPKTSLEDYKMWLPYLRGLGILSKAGVMRPTSPSLRGRMNPLALQAMQDYMTATQGQNWADYINWSGMFMPRTPTLTRRQWLPSYWR